MAPLSDFWIPAILVDLKMVSYHGFDLHFLND